MSESRSWRQVLAIWSQSMTQLTEELTKRLAKCPNDNSNALCNKDKYLDWSLNFSTTEREDEDNNNDKKYWKSFKGNDISRSSSGKKDEMVKKIYRVIPHQSVGAKTICWKSFTFQKVHDDEKDFKSMTPWVYLIDSEICHWKNYRENYMTTKEVTKPQNFPLIQGVGTCFERKKKWDQPSLKRFYLFKWE